MAAEVKEDENLHSKSKVPKYPISAQGLTVVCFSMSWILCFQGFSFQPVWWLFQSLSGFWSSRGAPAPLALCSVLLSRGAGGPWGSSLACRDPAGILHHDLHFSRWIFIVFLFLPELLHPKKFLLAQQVKA